MNRRWTILLFSLMAWSSVTATAWLRPKLEVTPIVGGLHVELDFQEVSPADWSALLAQPDAFHAYGYGVSGSPGDAALPLLTEMIPVLSADTGQIANLQIQSYVLDASGLKAVPEGHLDSDPHSVQIRSYDWERGDRTQVPLASLGAVVDLKGQQLLPVTIRPITLDAADRRLRVPRSLSFDLLGITAGSPDRISEDGGVRSISHPGDTYASRGHYLIITPPVFEPYIQYFADWKLRAGYEVTIVSTTTTGTSASGIKASCR